MKSKRKYPVGIQSFETIRRDGYLYVDKTPLIYRMITEGKPYFLSRPRRFGKSLLVSTLAAIFEGRRELFEAFTTDDGIEQPQLFIATTNWRWEEHPVLRFDFSETNLKQFVKLEEYVMETLLRFEERYGLTDMVMSHSLAECVRNAHKKTGRRVVVLVDEYDTLMLHSLGNPEQMMDARDTFSALFGPLKSLDEHLKFVFITGISKFSQMGIFSRLNNLLNISMLPAYDSLCGISEEELTTQLRPDIEMLGQANGYSYEEQLAELKRMYDGYHFSKAQKDMYNPFSLVNAFMMQDVRDFWFASGTSIAVIELLAKMPPVSIESINGVQCETDAFDNAIDNYASPLPLLYQSGYLTIKDYDREFDEYTLGFPNLEVSKGFANCLYQHITHRQLTANEDKNRLLRAYKMFQRDDDLTAFIEAIKAFFASLPHQWGKDNRNEHYYHSLLYTLLVAFGADVRAEEPTAKGQSDLVLLMPKGIYVIEIKYDGSAEAALAQIETKGYAGKYRLDGRPVTKVGIAFSSKERNITEFKTHNS